MQCDSFSKCISSVLFVSPMKSSTKTSIIFTVFEGMDGCRYCGIMMLSNLCQGSAVLPFTNSDMTSLEVSDLTQNKGGNSHHQICNVIVTTSHASSSDTGQTLAAGRTTCETNRRQKPSVMLILVNSKGNSRS